MARKKIYAKRRRKKNLPIIAVIIAVGIVIYFASRIFSHNEYTSVVQKILDSDISYVSSKISSISAINAEIYSEGDIKYKNQHKDIVKISEYEIDTNEDLQEYNILKKVLEKLVVLDKLDLVKDIPEKDNGYYWVDLNIKIKNKIIVIKTNKDYYIDLYYDIDNKIIYTKEKYYDEFNKKNNKVEFIGYKVDEEMVELLDNLIISQ